MAPSTHKNLFKDPLVTLPSHAVGTSSGQRGARVTNMMSSAAAVGKKAQRSRSVIKKAYVRFDDYLDLNEENMRRSCKKIMNKLYCDPVKTTNDQIARATVMSSDPPTPAALLSAKSNVCRPKSPPPLLQQHPPESVEAPKSVNHSTTSSAVQSKDRTITIAIRPSKSTVASSSPSLAENASEPVAQLGAEKSYLRSQYERRQKRQLELMRKMQRTLTTQQEEDDDADPQMVMNFNLINECKRSQVAVGDDLAKFNQVDNGQTRAESVDDEANNKTGQGQRQQNHDLVAKSHELSKRRFFENLERRESMKKNSELLSTQSGEWPQATRGTIFERRQPKSSGPSGAANTDNGLARGLQLFNESKKQIFQECSAELSAAAYDHPSAVTNGADGHTVMSNIQHSIATSEAPSKSHSLSDNIVALTEQVDGTLGQSSRPPSMMLATLKSSPPPLPAKPETTNSSATNELIGSRTLLPLSQRAALQRYGESASLNNSQGCGRQQSRLIEFSQASQAHSIPLDRSAFEIKVLPSSSEDQFDGFPGASECLSNGFLIVKQVDEANDTIQTSNSNKTLPIDASSSSTSNPDGDDEPMASASAAASERARFQDKEEADRMPSKGPTDNNDATRRQNQETIKVQSSDNRYQLPAIGNASDVEEASGEVRGAAKVISESISSKQVNQEDASEPGNHDGAEMKKVAPASTHRESVQTTSKQAADKNNARAAEHSEHPTCSMAQLASNKVDGKSGNHECPEIKPAPMQSAPAFAADKGHGHVFNEPIAATTSETGASSDAQAKQQVAPVALANTSEIVPNVDEADATRTERGSHVGPLLGSDVAADSGMDADEQAACSLQTIITNEVDARDVLPEANTRMLNTKIGSDVSATVEASETGPLLPPLDNSVGDEAARKVALQVEMSNFGRDLAHGSAAAPFKLQEIASHDQCGGGSLFQATGLKKRHLSERPRSPLPVGHRELARSHDEQPYANPSLNLLVSRRALDHCNDSTHHDYVSAHSKSSLLTSKCENVQCDRSDDHHLIKPLYHKQGKSSRSIQTETHEKAGRHLSNATMDEDLRSSCSSSGFGASVSATSSSSSTDSNSSASSPQHHHHHSFRDKKLEECSGFEGTSRSQKGDQIYDMVRPSGFGRNLHMARESVLDSMAAADSHRSAMSNDTYAQLSQLVGPDQAYPCKRPLLIENHGYASLVNRCQLDIGYSRGAFQPKECYSSVQYANLRPSLESLSAPANPTMPEYATVRAPLQRAANDIGASIHACQTPAENKKLSTSLDGDDERPVSSGSSGADDCDNGSSGRNDSLSSTYSGGFSKLPPVRLIDHNFANTVDSSGPLADAPGSLVGSESQQSGKRTTSLLKRFGSLVSRAFTSTTNGSGEQSLANLGPTAQKASGEDETSLKKDATDNATYSKTIARGGEACERITSKKRDAKSFSIEADLVVLPTKNKQVFAQNMQQPEYAARYHGARGSVENHNDSRFSKPFRRCRSKQRVGRLSRSISITSDTCDSYSSASSLEYLSLISTPGHTNREKLAAQFKDQPSEKTHPRRASSLSDELESLMSPSEVAELQRDSKHRKITATKWQPSKEAVVKRSNKARTHSRISIDCVSPTQHPAESKISGGDNLSAKPRSLLRWLSGQGVANSMHSLPSNSPAPRAGKLAAGSTDHAGEACYDPKRQIKTSTVAHNQLDSAVERKCGEVSKRQHHSMNGFLSLIDRGHASSEHKLDRSKTSKAKRTEDCGDLSYDVKEPVSLIYSRLYRDRSDAAKKSGRRCSRKDSGKPIFHSDGKRSKTVGAGHDGSEDDFELPGQCQSLNIYQTLMRSYVRKRHHRRHHSRGHYGHYHHHHASTNCSHKSATCCKQTITGDGRHGQVCAPTRCDEQCASSYWNAKSESSTTRSYGDKSRVWGQLIKINKPDGSQVIELQRAPSKSWGFFVARGAINNIKGIFISRMHDSVTSSSLAGLLSIGDRILSIDDCPIGPDFDILRVNQMISKRSKIVLKVKPFKC